MKEGWEFVQSGGEYNKVKQSVVYEMRCDRNAKEVCLSLWSGPSLFPSPLIRFILCIDDPNLDVLRSAQWRTSSEMGHSRCVSSRNE